MANSPRKLLFTPGPLTTSETVKRAMLQDMGSRDAEFIEIVADVRRRLLALVEVGEDKYWAIPMQGSGTYSLEAVMASVVPPDGKVLVIINGAYGRRLLDIGRTLDLWMEGIEFPEDCPVPPEAVASYLESDPEIWLVSMCHCETTSGVLNPVQAVGEVVARAGRQFFVDAMSSFGGIPLNVEAAHIDYLVSSSNKCIQGVPGFGIVLASKDALLKTRGWARSVSLDLLAQAEGLDKNGQFRFTPPTQVILACQQALRELEEEGGVAGRGARYAENHRVLLDGMTALGFVPYVDAADQSYIITSFHYPNHPRFDFDTFYEALRNRGFITYPGKVSEADCFRIGTIGHLFPEDMRELLVAVDAVLGEMNISLSTTL